MSRTVVLDVVGLTQRHLGQDAPHLTALAREGASRPIQTILPAVTCSVQSTYLTGLYPRDHGCVGNGWYLRDLAEVAMWRQSNHLVGGERVWDAARSIDPEVTVANLFWWYNMYGGVDWSVTPRPIYPADGRKLPDVYTQPAQLRDEVTDRFGVFPLFHFWGPAADLRSTRWIAAAARYVYDTRKPSLTLVYLPHLDYDLQRFGPDDPRSRAALRDVDAVCGQLIDHVRADGANVIVLSEYGITAVTGAIHVNRALREAGLLTVRDELGEDKLDAGASAAFAVADHQIAHVYVRDRGRVAEVRRVLERIDGIERVLAAEEQRAVGLDHARSGDLTVVSAADRWFSYAFWLDDARAPDYARTVDIHRKPGYDPCELFIDPALHAPQLQIGWTLLRKAMGLRTLMKVVPLDDSLVRGSHGRPTDDLLDGPVLISSEPSLLADRPIAATEVKQLILDHLAINRRRGIAAAAG
jgi:predicted AlkP superfamily pyrophosphatase or phosphodiesterase